MDSFELSSPMVADPDVTSTSFHDQLASEIGRMTGGMMAEGSEEELNGSSVLVLLQAVVHEAGVEAVVLGCKPSLDGKSTFAALSDGSIFRVSHSVRGGRIVTVGHRAVSEEAVSDCDGIDGIGDLARQVVAQSLATASRVDGGDSVSGHVLVDAHGAICGKILVKGSLVVNVGETNAIRCGVRFVLDCPSGVLPERVVDYVRIQEMTMDEIKEELKSNQEALGISNPFPTKMGSA